MNFSDSMLKCNTGMEPSDKWKVLEKAYDNAMSNSSQVPRIPKIIHQIWLGSPFPDKYKILTDQWKTLNPGWDFILWDEKKIEEFGLVNKWMYENMRNPSAKSDVVRYEVAYSYGGIYVDTDFYACRNFEKLLYLDFFCGMVGSYDGSPVSPDTCITPSIFGCSQGNKLVEKIILKIGEQTTVPKSVAEIMMITGPNMFSKIVANELKKHPMSVVLPPSYLHSFPGQIRESIRNLNFENIQQAIVPYKYPETYAMHLCYCSWQKQELL